MKLGTLWAAVGAASVLFATGVRAEAPQGIDACVSAVGAAHPGKLIKVERKTEKEGAIYEFDVHGVDGKQYDIECSAHSGKITEVEQEVDSANDPAFKAKVKVTLEQAQQTALQQHPGAITETEYEIEADGAASYEFDIEGKDGKEIKVEVDATSGAIVEANPELWQIGAE